MKGDQERGKGNSFSLSRSIKLIMCSASIVTIQDKLIAKSQLSYEITSREKVMISFFRKFPKEQIHLEM